MFVWCGDDGATCRVLIRARVRAWCVFLVGVAELRRLRLLLTQTKTHHQDVGKAHTFCANTQTNTQKNARQLPTNEARRAPVCTSCELIFSSKSPAQTGFPPPLRCPKKHTKNILFIYTTMGYRLYRNRAENKHHAERQQQQQRKL